MKRQQALFLGVYVGLSLIHVGALLVDAAAVAGIVKPWLMPVLAAWFLSATPAKYSFLRGSLLAGLAFSTVGDVLLLFSREKTDALFFLLGLLAFLVAQLSYAGGFLSAVGTSKGFLSRSPLSGGSVVVFLVAFLYWLLPGVPEGLRWPVVLYGAALTGMVLSVLHARWRLGEVAFSRAMSGALLFLLSDCLLAVARFGQPFPYADAAVMATYLLGQGLLANGACLYLQAKKNKKAAAA